VKLNAYAVRDSKADKYNRPYFIGTHGEAIRAFADACRKDGNVMAEHPEDFNLYFIGTFDEESGELDSVKPLHLASALDGKKPVPVTN